MTAATAFVLAAKVVGFLCILAALVWVVEKIEGRKNGT